MLEPIYDRSVGDSRAMLVAYSISAAMRARRARNEVECFSVEEREVRDWH
jgi:hypothetical protein